MTQEMIANMFEEWKRRYDLDPAAFQDHAAWLAERPLSYGERAAEYFMDLLYEMYIYEVDIDKYVRRA